MTTPDVNDIKAGEYELVAVQWDEVLSKPGEPLNYRRHRRGDKVTLNVEDARRLVLAGAVVEPGSLERAAAERAKRAYEQALAALPPEPKTARPPKDIGDFPVEGSVDAQNAWVVEANVGQVKAEAEKGPEVKASLLAAELRRGEAARKTVVDALSEPPPA